MTDDYTRQSTLEDLFQIVWRVERDAVQDVEDGVEKQPWYYLDFNRVKILWADYARQGVVRDEKGMQKICDQTVETICKIHANTTLCGHHSYMNEEVFIGTRFEDSTGWFEPSGALNYFLDDNGAYRLSDYALDDLMDKAVEIREAETAEKKLYLVDCVFNIVHQRSDIASWFLKGGTNDFLELATLEV